MIKINKKLDVIIKMNFNAVMNAAGAPVAPGMAAPLTSATASGRHMDSSRHTSMAGGLLNHNSLGAPSAGVPQALGGGMAGLAEHLMGVPGPFVAPSSSRSSGHGLAAVRAGGTRGAQQHIATHRSHPLSPAGSSVLPGSTFLTPRSGMSTSPFASMEAMRPSAASATSGGSGETSALLGGGTEDICPNIMNAPSGNKSKTAPTRSTSSAVLPRSTQWPVGRGAWGWGMPVGHYPTHVSSQFFAAPPMFTPMQDVQYQGMAPSAVQVVLPHFGVGAGGPVHNHHALRSARSV